MSRPTFPGLHIRHDPRNERWLWTDTQPKLVARAAEPAPWKPKTVRHRQYNRYDQGNEPSCTGYSCVTYLSAAHPYNKPSLTGSEWYRLNQEQDRANGIEYSEGATVTSAMETGRTLGYWAVYRWIYDMPNTLRALEKAPVIAGTVWYPSMFERDAEGIVRKIGVNESPVGGHQYVLGAYDAKRDLLDVEQTWAPNTYEVGMPYKGWVYRIPGEIMYRLIREEGEISQPDEVKMPKKLKAAA